MFAEKSRWVFAENSWKKIAWMQFFSNRPSNPGRACICNFFSTLINIKIYFFTPRIFLYIIIIFIIKIHYSLNFYLIIFCSVNNNFGTKNIKYQYLFYFHIVGIYFKVICLILSFPDLSITKIMSSQTS